MAKIGDKEGVLKVGIIGAGFVANFHARALQSVRGVEVSAIYALKGAEELRDRAIAAGIGRPVVCDSIQDLCQKAEAVCLFLPNYARVEAVKAIVKAAGKGSAVRALIAEKPLARNVAEANEILSLVKSKGWPAAYFENQIHMPAVISARQQLKAIEKQMGPPSLVRTAEEHGGPHEPWFWDPTRQGGGVWCDMGCHSVAVGEEMATPSSGKRLVPLTVTANMGLLKWGHEPWRSRLLKRGVDYSKTPAEDYACVTYSFESERAKTAVVQATDSWMYEAPGLRLNLEMMGPGYAINVNTLNSPAGIFISDDAAVSVANAELALEKSQASRGQLVVQPNEPDLYGYVGEWRDAVPALKQGKSGQLDLAYGARVVKLVMAAYLSHERATTIDLKRGEFLDSKELASYVPLIQQGKGAKVLGC
jgi:predicted dehydrogenase